MSRVSRLLSPCLPAGPFPAPATHLALALLLATGLGSCAPAPTADPFDPDLAAEGLALGPPFFHAPRAWEGDRVPFPPEENPWASIREERIRSLLGPAMDRAGVDAWVLICRENHNDPLAHHVGCENAGGTAAFLFFREGPGEGPAGEARVRSLAFSPAGEATALRDVGLHDSVAVLSGETAFQAAARELRARNPGVIAVNSANLAVADGLSHTQRRQLEAALGPDLTRRLVSAEELVVQWLSVKTDREVEIMARAAAITEALEIEAYARVVPGRTTDADLARYLKRRMAQLGVEDAWSPDQNPNVNSGPDRGHSHATDRVIRPGDFIQTDFGIRVWGMWVSDIQRFGYVLAPGETEAPPEAQGRWRAAVRGSRAAFEAMRPGVRGLDVDLAQRAVMDEEGSLDVYWSTGHPVGYWAHDVGPALSGGQRTRPPSPAVQRLLLPGQVFAFDGFFSWELEGDEEGTKTISVEEMAVITGDGARWLSTPQEELILIPSR
jgi:Xaa-Pro aminopeptidase